MTGRRSLEADILTYRNIEISKKKVADFCRRWKITEFALFGSIADGFSQRGQAGVLHCETESSRGLPQ
jgi:hypothetical protein